MTTASYSPSPVAFGNVIAGVTTSTTVTVKNSGLVPVTLSVTGAGFSMSPSSVPAAVQTLPVPIPSSATVTVTFAPTQAASYTGSISGSDGSTCSLTGAGYEPLLSFDPSPVSVGNVFINTSTTQTVTVTNAANVPRTLSVTGTGFSIDTTSIAAGTNGVPSSVVVTVTFSPTSAMTYTGTITGSDATTCGLGGTGVDPSARPDADLYLSESPTNAAAGDKYLELAVPNYSLNGDPNNPGNSFVRLGVFPSVAPGAELSPGFQQSLKLANLVGDPTQIQLAEGTGPNQDTVPGGFSDGSGLPSPYDGKGDSNYLLGFADDTRLRGTPDDGTMTINNMAPLTITAGQTVANTPANRQAETLSLLTKGGWWDHSDGNRITTTVGDKIEIIQGNYKLVVLGRQPLPPPRTGSADTNYSNLVDNAFITDVSGGHFQEQYPSPTPCIKTIEYSLDASTNEWTLYQDNSLGNLITKLKGRTVDMFQGSSRETYVGSDPTLSTNSSDWTPSSTLDPVLTSKTWAQRIMTYVGSAQKPVPEIFTLTFADAIQDIKFVTGDVLGSTSATTAINVTTAGVVGNLYLAPLTLELTAGLKVQLQPVVLGIHANKTRIFGDSVTVGGSGTVATLTEDEVRGIKNSVTSLRNDVAADNLTIAATMLCLHEESVSTGGARTELAGLVNLGV
jgi:hypothetical protein